MSIPTNLPSTHPTEYSLPDLQIRLQQMSLQDRIQQMRQNMPMPTSEENTVARRQMLKTMIQQIDEETQVLEHKVELMRQQLQQLNQNPPRPMAFPPQTIPYLQMQQLQNNNKK